MFNRCGLFMVILTVVLATHLTRTCLAAPTSELVRLLESPIGRRVMFGTPTGVALVERILGSRVPNEADLPALIHRLGDREMGIIAGQVESGLSGLEREHARRFPFAHIEPLNGRAARYLPLLAGEHLLPAYTAIPVELDRSYRTAPEVFLRGLPLRSPTIPAGLSLEATEAGRSKRWQEVIWQLRESGLSGLADNLESSIEAYLREGAILRQEILGTGATESYLLHYADGTIGVFKPGPGNPMTNYHYEIAAYRFDRLAKLDRVPVTVERTIGDRVGSVQLFITDVTPINIADVDEQVGTLGYLLGNTDRPGNLVNLPHGQRRQVAIDHSLSFSEIVGDPHAGSQVRPGRGLYSRIQALSTDQIERVLRPFVSERKIRAVIERRALLLARGPGLAE